MAPLIDSTGYCGKITGHQLVACQLSTCFQPHRRRMGELVSSISLIYVAPLALPFIIIMSLFFCLCHFWLWHFLCIYNAFLHLILYLNLHFTECFVSLFPISTVCVLCYLLHGYIVYLYIYIYIYYSLSCVVTLHLLACYFNCLNFEFY